MRSRFLFNTHLFIDATLNEMTFFCILQDELVLKVKHDLLSHQAVQEIKVLIPSERIEKHFKYTYTTTVNEVCLTFLFILF
jgi:hypothetical protein